MEHQISRELLNLCRSMACRDLEFCPEGYNCRSKCLRDKADLVELEQMGVAGIHLYAFHEPAGIVNRIFCSLMSKGLII